MNQMKLTISHKQELEKLFNICHVNLKNSEELNEYLFKKRKISKETIDKYKIGYFPRNINVLTKYVSEDILKELTIINAVGSSHFSSLYYLVIPIYSEYSEATGIGGRVLIGEEEREILELPKYKNSRYIKSDVLYGLNFARESILKQQNVYVVEGYFDQISMYSHGIKNTVAICGTAFSYKHLLRLAKYTNKITFILDGDEAGKKSMKNIGKKFLNRGINLKFATLPKEFKDSDEYFSSDMNKNKKIIR